MNDYKTSRIIYSQPKTTKMFSFIKTWFSSTTPSTTTTLLNRCFSSVNGGTILSTRLQLQQNIGGNNINIITRTLATKPTKKKEAGGAKKKSSDKNKKGSKTATKKAKGMGVAPSVPMNKDMFAKIILEESRRFAAMKALNRQGTSKDEREVGLAYARGVSKRRNKMDFAWEIRALLRDAAIAALPTEQLREEAKKPLKNPLFPLSFMPAMWTPPSKSQ
jgi:hypothetical protein